LHYYCSSRPEFFAELSLVIQREFSRYGAGLLLSYEQDLGGIEGGITSGKRLSLMALLTLEIVGQVCFRRPKVCTSISRILFPFSQQASIYKRE
jgi:hypothetical protein